jgi:hypothetical protein
MKAKHAIISLATTALVLGSVCALSAQGTVTFNNPWVGSGVGYASLWYYDGLSFRVSPAAPQPHDAIAVVGAVLDGHPSNGTPHMEFVNRPDISEYVAFSLTNGGLFGVTSVDLADPVAPSLSPVSISFNGFKWDGSAVSQTFTTGGGGVSTFQTYYFNTDFANGLVRVEIPSAAWAMDNLLWVPEPSTTALAGLGLLALGLRRRECRTSGAKIALRRPSGEDKSG